MTAEMTTLSVIDHRWPVVVVSHGLFIVLRFLKKTIYRLAGLKYP